MPEFSALRAAVQVDPSAVAEFEALQAALVSLEGQVAELERGVTVEIQVSEGRVSRVVADRHCQVLVRESGEGGDGQGDVGEGDDAQRLHLYEVATDPTCATTLIDALQSGRLDGITRVVVD